MSSEIQKAVAGEISRVRNRSRDHLVDMQFIRKCVAFHSRRTKSIYPLHASSYVAKTDVKGIKQLGKWVKTRVSLQMEDLMRHIQEHVFLANAHMTAFFTSDHWHCLVPEQWREELLQLTDAELASKYSFDTIPS